MVKNVYVRVFLRRVLRHSVCEGGQVLNVFVVEPLDLEVQVHVVSSFAELMLLMLCTHTDIHTLRMTQTHRNCVPAVTDY